MSDLKFTHPMPNSRYVQKIKFVRENEIIVVSDTSHFCHLDFSNETKIAYSKLPLLKRALPFLPLLYPNAQHYIEDL